MSWIRGTVRELLNKFGPVLDLLTYPRLEPFSSWREKNRFVKSAENFLLMATRTKRTARQAAETPAPEVLIRPASETPAPGAPEALIRPAVI
jgi:hypothetical protein